MGLGYLTLAIKSEQDKYLTGNPSFTFFKSVYKKHTNFAIDYQFVNLVGDSSNSLGKKVYVEIPKNGDLLHRMYITLDIKGTSLEKITPLAYSLIEYVDLFLGGQRVDRHYGTWLHIWHELNESSDKQTALSEMISNHPADKGSKNKVYIPLRFWFNNNIGSSLPLIALQYNDIKLEIKLADKVTVNKYCENTVAPVQDLSLNISQIQLLCEFIHLDTDERRMFASNSHEYLITQLQTSLHNPINLYKTESRDSYEKIHHKTQLRFNHPIKELIWTFQDNSGLIYKQAGNLLKYTNDGVLSNNYWRGFSVGHDQMIGANLVLNGKEMTEELPASFYRNIQHYQYHTGCNLKNITDNSLLTERPGAEYINYSKGSGIYSYSLCLSPETSQPSGSLNFSNLESAELKYRLFKKNTFTEYEVTVWDVGGIDISANPTPTSIDGYSSTTGPLSMSDGDTVILSGQSLVGSVEQNGVYKYVRNSSILVLMRDPDFDALLNAGPVLVKVKNGAGKGGSTALISLEHQKTLTASGLNYLETINIEEYADQNNVPQIFELNSKVLTVYAVNYNVLRIMSGMSSVLFSS